MDSPKNNTWTIIPEKQEEIHHKVNSILNRNARHKLIKKWGLTLGIVLVFGTLLVAGQSLQITNFFSADVFEFSPVEESANSETAPTTNNTSEDEFAALFGEEASNTPKTEENTEAKSDLAVDSNNDSEDILADNSDTADKNSEQDDIFNKSASDEFDALFGDPSDTNKKADNSNTPAAGSLNSIGIPTSQPEEIKITEQKPEEIADPIITNTDNPEEKENPIKIIDDSQNTAVINEPGENESDEEVDIFTFPALENENTAQENNNADNNSEISFPSTSNNDNTVADTISFPATNSNSNDSFSEKIYFTDNSNNTNNTANPGLFRKNTHTAASLKSAQNLHSAAPIQVKPAAETKPLNTIDNSEKNYSYATNQALYAANIRKNDMSETGPELYFAFIAAIALASLYFTFSKKLLKISF